MSDMQIVGVIMLILFFEAVIIGSAIIISGTRKGLKMAAFLNLFLLYIGVACYLLSNWK